MSFFATVKFKSLVPVFVVDFAQFFPRQVAIFNEALQSAFSVGHVCVMGYVVGAETWPLSGGLIVSVAGFVGRLGRPSR